MRFETEQDLIRERKAIEVFAKTFGVDYVKLDPNDVDYKILKDGQPIAYADVKGRIRTMNDAYPLPIAVRKLVKLMDKRLDPVVIWACEDGIIYGKASKLYGQIRLGGRTERTGSVNDIELMAYYEKQDNLKYVRYI
jgi:hypothetical protein